MPKIIVSFRTIPVLLPLEKEFEELILNKGRTKKIVSFFNFKKGKNAYVLIKKKQDIAAKIASSAKEISWLYTEEDLKEG